MRFPLHFEFDQPSNEYIEAKIQELKVTIIKFNGIQICPVVETESRRNYQSVGNGGSCAEFNFLGKEMGRWRGSLTIYPQQTANRIRVEIYFDQRILEFTVIDAF